MAERGESARKKNFTITVTLPATRSEEQSAIELDQRLYFQPMILPLKLRVSVAFLLEALR